MTQIKTTPPVIIPQLLGRLFIVGDIHGCLAEADVILNYVRKDLSLSAEKDLVIFLGDYIDRGPNSAGVIDALIDFKAHFPSSIFLRGNHEQFLRASVNLNSNAQQAWMKSGGLDTIASYGGDIGALLNPGSVIPETHIAFYESLERYVIGPDFVCVHAGLDPLKDLLLQPDEVIYWIRDPFLNNPHAFGKTIIFGHTPQKEVLFEPPLRIGLDTGIVYGNKLSMMEFTSSTLYQVAPGSSSVRVTKL